MRVYFLSARRCALRINGAFAGYADGFPRFLDLSPRDLPFCEFLPVDSAFCPLRFVFTEEIAFRPPAGLSLCFLPDGVALYADKFLCADAAFRLLARREVAGGTMTVFSQSGVHYLWERTGEAKTGDLGEAFRGCGIAGCGGCVLLQGEGALCAIGGDGTPFFRGAAEQVVFDRSDGEEAGGTLRVVAPAGDFRGRKTALTFRCENGRADLQERTRSDAKPLPERFALCALLQALQQNEDEEAAKLLSGDLLADLPALKDYFGAYTAVFPLPFTPFAAGMLRQKRPNVYEMKGYAAEMKEGRIQNIRRTF